MDGRLISEQATLQRSGSLSFYDIADISAKVPDLPEFNRFRYSALLADKEKSGSKSFQQGVDYSFR